MKQITSKLFLLKLLTGTTLLLLSLSAANAVAPNTKSVGTNWVDANGVSLRYELTGNGDDTLVLIHEMAMSLESWDLVMPELTKNHRVLRYDLRGFGLSEKIRGAMTFTDEVEDLRGLLDVLEIKGKVTLIGGAIGGAISLAFAATYPDRVKGLIAMSPATSVTPQRRVAVMADAALSDRTGMRTILAGQMPGLYPPDIRVSDERTNWFLNQERITDTTSMAACLRMIASTDFSDYYPKITAPTLVIAVGLYPQRPVETVKLVADAIKGAQFQVLQTGHFIAAQSPELLLPVLNKFLATLPR
ncbi:MAG: alpha/beta hydrolase [Steroidobacteraceae bacterium]